jgi:peptidyl-prolyl cis-trans isomerase SurA
MRRATAALRRCRLLLVLVLPLAAGALPAAGQQTNQRIVAVVNDESITAYDVAQRVKLVIGPNQQPSPDQMRRLTTQVLRTMIDERLQLQEARRLGISADPDELAAAIAGIERQNNIPAGHLKEALEAQGLSYASFEQQARAAITWPKVVRRRAARLVMVNEDEIDEALERIRENADKPSHLVSQIFLSVDSPQDEAEVRANVERLYAQLGAGAPFTTLARQFSQDSSASSGGDIGWVQPGQLPPEIDQVLEKMPVGAVSQPIRAADGYYIVALRERREPRITSPGDLKVSLDQVFLPIAADAGAEERTGQMELAKTISETVNGCDDMDKLAKEMESPQSGSMGTLRTGDLAPDMRKVVAGLEVGQPSQPFLVDGGVRILMVCERESPVANLPSRQEVQRLLSEQKMELQSRRFLRDLRQSAFVDIRA